MSHVTTSSLVVSRCASIDTSTDRSSAGGWLLLLYSTPLHSTLLHSMCVPILSHPSIRCHYYDACLSFNIFIFTPLSSHSSFRLCLPYTSLPPLLWSDLMSSDAVRCDSSEFNSAAIATGKQWCTRISARVCMNVCVWVCWRVNVCICVYVGTWICVCVCVCACFYLPPAPLATFVSLSQWESRMHVSKWSSNNSARPRPQICSAFLDLLLYT